ncbi:MAG TPA: NDP-sugar synthase [Thermoanaerobaculia bacterium]|nr:NDP-sugar synthase [Thermoanaerobaculia bacterium]
MKGMILAAGFGTRLQPVTHTLPKPMVPLLNRPLIAWAVESFLAAGVRELIVNLHHLPEPLERYLSDEYAGRAEFFFSREETILGTGGGIRRVQPQLATEDEFFLVNGDTVQFPRWDALREARRALDAIAALTLRHAPENDKFTPVFLDDGRVTGFGNGTGEAMMFAGSHVISTRIFETLPDRDFSGIVEHAYIPLLASQRESLAGVVDDGLWFDIGTPQRYISASRALLEETIRGALAPVPGSQVQGDSLLHDTARGSVTRSVIGAHSTVEGDVRDSVIWDDCHVPAGAVVEGCIVAHGVQLDAGEYRNLLIVPGQSVAI